LCIANYSIGLTGAAHDATAFEHTVASKHPEFLFEGKEFAWTDSAYPLGEQVIPVHKMLALNLCHNVIFDKAVSHIWVQSEHCMGALKGQFQCLCGLHVNIDSPEDHIEAL
jgi:DDE superfamily endonuclease